MNILEIQNQLCEQLCRNIKLHERADGVVMIDNPFTLPDGDSLSLYLSPTSNGAYKISDLANIIMRLSYEEDTDKYYNEKRTQGKLLQQILQESEVSENNGEFYVESKPEKLAENIMRLSQVLTQIYNLGFLSRDRTESTFYKDLEDIIRACVDSTFIAKKYFFPCDVKEEYETDFYLRNPKDEGRNLCIYGIPSKDKAQLVTIILQFLQQNNEDHDNLLIFSDQSKIPSQVLARLSNVGGEQVATLGAERDIERKINKRLMNGHPLT